METMRGAVRQPGPDLSHEERDACLHALGALHAAGRLSLPELDARIEAALAARTDDELVALVRESSGIEVAPRRATHEERRAMVAAGARRVGGWLFALRFLVFLVLALLVGLVRVLAVAAVALGVVLVRALLLAAWGGRLAYRALVRRSRTWGASLGRADARVVPARLQLQRAPSKELVLVPRPQVPAQREPAKVHPVLVPSEADSTSTALVLARRSTEVVLAGQTAPRGDLFARGLATVERAFPRDDRRVRALVSQLRPLVHRVADRARWGRMTTNACERAALTKGWRRTSRFSRTAF
jgi:Domain of unknown function (DUF1707)